MHRSIYVIAVAFVLSIAPATEANEILGLFPHFGYSHFNVFYPLLSSLVELGHNVTVITYIKSSNKMDNYNELLLKEVEVVNVVPLSEWKPRTWKGLLEEYVGLHEEGQESCERLYESGYIQQVLRRHNEEKPYDLVITEYFNSDCQLVVPYLMKTPIVALTSCLLMPWYYDRILLPDTPSYIQSEFIGFSTPLNWYERLTNFLQAKILSLLYRYHTNQIDNALIYRHLNVTVDVADVARQQTSIIFGNQHYSLIGSRPYPASFVEIGGIHIQEETINEPLPKEIDAFLKMSEKEILFISWGSMIRSSTMEPRKLTVILSVLQKSDFNIIWKWETDQIPIKHEKFLFVKWVPQLKLLCHPKIKLFWGHGGLLGTTEAVYCGKPMILTPIYGDQFVNAHAVENRKIGRILDFGNITEFSLQYVMQEVQQQRYTENAKAISKIFRDRPLKPLATATWWVEHILKHKRAPEFLHSHAVNLNWFIYYSLDSISIITAMCALLFFVFKYSTKMLLNKFLRKKLKQKKN